MYLPNIFDVKEPASITKIMTAIVAVKNCSLDSNIVCSSNVVNLGVSDAVVLGLHEGDSFTLDQALRLMLISSYNDLAVAIAEPSIAVSSGAQSGSTEGTRLFNVTSFL